MTDDLRTRIATTMLRIFDEDRTLTVDMGAWIVADAVITTLDLGTPCAATGCRMRQIARRHAEASSDPQAVPCADDPGEEPRSLKERLILGALGAITRSDPLVTISFGPAEVNIGWVPHA